MTNFKRGFAATTAIVIFFCLLENGSSQQDEDLYWEAQIGDWQPSKFTSLKIKPKSKTAFQPSPNESPIDSSRNLADSSASTRQRNRDVNVARVFVEPQQSHYFAQSGNFNENQPENQSLRPANNLRVRNGYRNFPRRKNEIESIQNDRVNVQYVRRVDAAPGSRRVGFKNEKINRNYGIDNFDESKTDFLRRSDHYSGEFPPRRFQGTKKHAELERRMSIGVEEVSTPVVDVTFSTNNNNLEKPATALRGSQHYSIRENDLGKERTLQDRGRKREFASRSTTPEATAAPIDLNDVNQKAYIVLPENQHLKFNEINQKHQPRNHPGSSKVQQNFIPHGSEYQISQKFSPETDQTHRRNDQNNARASQEIKSAEYFGRNSNFVLPSVQGIQTSESPKSNVVYQYPEETHLNGASQQWTPQSDQTRSSSKINFQNVPEKFNTIKTSNVPQPNEENLSAPKAIPNVLQQSPPIQAFDLGTGLPTRKIDRNFRSRKPQRRGEPTTTAQITEFVSSDSPPVDKNQNKPEKVFQTAPRQDFVAEHYQSSKNTELKTPNNYSVRERRRQSLSRTNQKPVVYTVLPSSSAESTPNLNEIPTQTFASRNRQERPLPRFNSLRNRSRYQQASSKPSQSGEIIQKSKNANDNEIEKSSPIPITSTLRSVTRLVTRTAVASRLVENKEEEEDTDDSPNYPKEFLEKLKNSKEYVPKIHGTASAPSANANHKNSESEQKRQTQETSTQQARNIQSNYRKPIENYFQNFASGNKQSLQKSDPESKKSKFYSTRVPTSITAASSTPTAVSSTSGILDETTTSTEFSSQELRRFVPKNKLTLEQRKQRIALLKEKLRQNATEIADQKKPKETLVPQANTHHSSREEEDPHFIDDHFEILSSSTPSTSPSFLSQSVTTPFSSTSEESDTNKTISKQDLLSLGSEDHIHITFFGNNETHFPQQIVNETHSLTMLSDVPSVESTTFTPSESITTQQPDFSVLNVTLFPSTRHRFSSRINSTTNLTLPQDVELINITPIPRDLSSTETPVEVFSQNIFSSSLNSSNTNENLLETISVTPSEESATNFFISTSTPTTTKSPVTAITTKRLTTKKNASARKKPSKKSNVSSSNSRRGVSNKSKTSKNKISTTTVSSSFQGTLDNNSNITITENNESNSMVGVEPLPLKLEDVESIINETKEVVNSKPMTSPKPATIPRSELNALTPETFSARNDGQNLTSRQSETTTPVSTLTDNNENDNNSTNPNQNSRESYANVQCIGESCENASSQFLHINNKQTTGDGKFQAKFKISGTTKSPQALRKIFIFGIFPNNTVRKRPFDVSAAQKGFRQGVSLRRFSTTTTTPQPDYDVFGIYPNNSIVRRRGWKTFDHEKYRSPYVIFGIYPNNTIVKKYPNGTIIEDEFMISDNEIKTMINERKGSTTCTCANKHQGKSDSELISTTALPRTSSMSPSSTTSTTKTTTTERAEEVTESSTTESFEVSSDGSVTEDDRQSENENADLNATTENGETTTEESSTTEETNEKLQQNNEIEEGTTNENKMEDEDRIEESITEYYTTTTFPIRNQAEYQSEGNENQLTTPRFNVDSVEKLEEIEKLDDVSTPKLGIGETTISPFTSDQNDQREIDDDRENDIINLSTPSNLEKELQLKELVDAEKADAAKIADSTEFSVDNQIKNNVGTITSDYEDDTTERNDKSQLSTTVGGSRFELETTTVFGGKYQDVVSTEKVENLEEEPITDTLEITTVRNERLQETTAARRDEGLEEGTTTIRNERLQETTAARRDEGLEEGTTTIRNERLQETTAARRDEGLEEGTTTIRNERLQETTAARRDEGLEEGTTTVRNERLQEFTAARRDEGLEEGTTTIASPSTVRNENFEELISTTQRYQNLETTPQQEGERTTTELFYYRPTENSPLSLNIEGNLVEKLTPRISTIGIDYDSIKSTSPKAIRKTTAKTTEKAKKTTVQDKTVNLPFLGNGFFRNLITSWFNQPTPKPTSKSKPAVGSTSTPPTLNPKSNSPNPKNIASNTKETSPKPAKKEESFSIDLFESTTPENKKSKDSVEFSTPASMISTTTNMAPSVTTFLPSFDHIKNHNLGAVEIISEPQTNNAQGYQSVPLGSPNANTLFVDRHGNLGTIIGPNLEFSPITYLQSTPNLPYPYERITASPVIGSGGPNVRPLSDAGIVSITFDGNYPLNDGSIIHNSIPSVLESYQIGPTTISPHIQRITSRQISPAVTPKTANPEPTKSDFLREENPTSKQGKKILEDQGRNFADFYGLESTTRDHHDIGSTITTDTPLNIEQIALSTEHVESVSNGNTVTKIPWKRTSDLDEPSSLTNVAFRALSTAEKIPFLDVATTTTTTTNTTPISVPTTSRPKKTKLATNSSGRIKIKKMKNLSRTSVMAYKNQTEMTSTSLPETVIIVTPMSKKESNEHESDTDADIKRQKIKFVTLTPGYVVRTDVQNPNQNDVLTLSSQHVQKVTKAPANIPENFLSTVYGEIKEKASSPLPEILKNVGNELDGNGLSVSLAKRVISLALEKAVSTSTTPKIPHSVPIFPSSPDLPTSTPSNRVSSTKPYSAAKKLTAPPKKQKLTTTEKAQSPIITTTKRQATTQTTTTTINPLPEQTILITPKRQAVQKVEKKNSVFLQTTERNTIEAFGEEFLNNPTTAKLVTNIQPLEELFNKEVSSKPFHSQKISEDLNALLSGLWEEPSKQPVTSKVAGTTRTVTSTTTTTTAKATTTTARSPRLSNASNKLKSQSQLKNNDEKIKLPKKASDVLSESDLKLLEGILAQQGIVAEDKELEKIIQNQIRLAEEVRKASRNLRGKKTTTTTTTEKPHSGSLGYLLNLFGSNGLSSSQPVGRGNSKKPSSSEASANSNNTPDPFSEWEEDSAVADRTARGELVSAAVDVTKAVSKFMGTVLTSAAQSLQSFVKSLRS